MATVVVKISRIVDLTNAQNQERYGLNQEALTGDDYQPTLQLARRLRGEGVEGAWTYSRADRPNGRQLVLFLDLLQADSEVRVREIRKVEL